MPNKPLLILLTGFLALLIGLIAFLLLSVQLSPKAAATPLETCRTLSVASEHGVNIIFFASKAQAEDYRDHLLKTAPFDQHQDALNFYYIDSYKPECTLYQGIALFCHSTDLVKNAASCPHDFIVVIDTAEARIRSSSYLNVMSINEKHPKSVFTHEFGHAFASFAEEYTPAPLSNAAKNCVKQCDDFSGETNGCYVGCSKNDYHRSIEAGVMRTLSSNQYGTYNERLIEQKIQQRASASLTGRVSSEAESPCKDQHHYLLQLRHVSGQLTLLNKTLERGCAARGLSGDYTYALTTASDARIETHSFAPELVYTDAPPRNPAVLDIEGEVFTYDGTLALTVPIRPQATELIITKGDTTLAEVPLYDVSARACLLQ